VEMTTLRAIMRPEEPLVEAKSLVKICVICPQEKQYPALLGRQRRRRSSSSKHHRREPSRRGKRTFHARKRVGKGSNEAKKGNFEMLDFRLRNDLLSDESQRSLRKDYLSNYAIIMSSLRGSIPSSVRLNLMDDSMEPTFAKSSLDL